VKDRSAVWQSGANSVAEEIDNRESRTTYRCATTAGHILRKFEAPT
jgi:hypothetical protein